MLHWSYTPEQKEEVKKALAAGVPKATILTYFYPEVTVAMLPCIFYIVMLILLLYYPAHSLGVTVSIKKEASSLFTHC